MAKTLAGASIEGRHQKLLRFGKLEAVLNSFAAAITIPFVLPYAVSLEATSSQIGLLTALPLLVYNLVQIPAARWGAHTSHPKAYLFVAGGLSRFSWLTLGLLLLVGRADYPTLFGVSVVASLSSGLLSPVWTSFLAAQVHPERRGRYFGDRNLLAGIASVAGLLLAAYMVSQFGFVIGHGWSLIFATVALSGALLVQIVAVSFAGVNELGLPSQPALRGLPSWRLSTVQNYVLYGALLILGAGMSTPFYSVHFISGLRGAPENAATLIAIANATAMLAQGLWGRVIDRHGLGIVANGSLGIIALIPLLWMAATDPVHAVPIWLLNGLAWAACNLANFSLVLAISNEENRPSVVAWVSVLQAPADFAAPLLGGFLADQLNLPALFLMSAGVRLAAWVCFFRSFPARDYQSRGASSK